MTTTFDITYECGFDGELGSIMSVDAHGHFDHDDVEVFLADTVSRELYDGGYDEAPTFGLEIEHLWRTEHSFVPDDPDDEYEERWTYGYSDEQRPGAAPVTRFQIASPWSRAATSALAPRAERDRRTNEFVEPGIDYFPLLCVHHPDEPATAGMPEDLFLDPSPEHVVDGYVHYCTPCRRAFDERLRIAREKAWAPERTRALLGACDDKVFLLAFSHPLTREDLTRVLGGADEDGRSRRALAAFAGAFRATARDVTRPVIVAQPGHKILMLRDIEHLVEDYARA